MLERIIDDSGDLCTESGDGESEEDEFETRTLMIVLIRPGNKVHRLTIVEVRPKKKRNRKP